MVTYTIIQYFQNDGAADCLYHDGTSPQPHSHYNGDITALMTHLGIYQTDATTWNSSQTPAQANSYFTTTGLTNDHTPISLYIIPESSGGSGGSGGGEGTSGNLYHTSGSTPHNEGQALNIFKHQKDWF